MVNGGALHDTNQAELEKLWRHRRKDARLRLDFGKNGFCICWHFSAAWTIALNQALRAERAALREYSRILANLERSDSHGKVPNERDQHSTAGKGQ